MSGVVDMLGSLRTLIRRREEQVRDFLGVVEIDTDARMGVLVMADHVAALLRVSGTDYAHAGRDERDAIVAGWADVLNSAGISLQILVHRRPITWDIPGGFLDLMRTQVEADLGSEWQRARFQRLEEALLRGELDGFPVMELHQYIVVRQALGDTENRRAGREGTIYLPPTRTWRTWDRPHTAFGGDGGAAAWRTRRDAGIEDLTLAIERLARDLSSVPGLGLEVCSGLEVSQLLHLLWRHDRALDEWIPDDRTLGQVRDGDLDLAWLERPEMTPAAPDPTIAEALAGRRRGAAGEAA